MILTNEGIIWRRAYDDYKRETRMFCGMDRVISQAGAYDESYGEIT